MNSLPRSVFTSASALIGAGLLAGCAASQDSSPSAPVAPGTLAVTAAMYPLEFVAHGVGGDLVDVTTLARPGVEPHDLELSPSAARELSRADLVLYVKSFQPAVDEAIASAGIHALSAHEVVPFLTADGSHAEPGGHDDHSGTEAHDHNHDHDHVHDHESDGHDDHAEHSHDDGHDHGDTDPHFWLDPTLMATLAFAVADEFSALDPNNAEIFHANAENLSTQLLALDQEFHEGLASCERDDIIVGHSAFGYLTHAYGLHQVSVAGLDPDAEPSPARVREIIALVRDSGATTIFTESTQGSVVDSIAADAGVAVAVLSPLENIATGEDYISTMTSNLAALRAGLGCA